MSALPSGSGVAARLAPAKPKTRGFLHIVRHGGGPSAIYILKYHRLDRDGAPPKPLLAESAQAKCAGRWKIFFGSAQPTSPICGSVTRRCSRKASSRARIKFRFSCEIVPKSLSFSHGYSSAWVMKSAPREAARNEEQGSPEKQGQAELK